MSAPHEEPIAPVQCHTCERAIVGDEEWFIVDGHAYCRACLPSSHAAPARPSLLRRALAAFGWRK